MRDKVLVWGGLGFLGQQAVTRLLDRGAEVAVLCRSRSLYPSPAWDALVDWYELDRPGAEATLLEAVSSASTIYNFAGSSGAVSSNREPLHSLDENCRTQLTFLAACQQAGHRPHVVFPSSWLVYAPGKTNPVGEEHLLGPLSMYAAHKLCIEHYLKIAAAQGHITYTICRISNPYGFDPAPTQRGYKILNAFIQLALANNPIEIFGDGRQLRDFIYIRDLTHALMLCGFASEARNQVFNISSGHSHSLFETVTSLIEMVGSASPVIFKPWPEEYRAVEPGHYVADISRARAVLGFHPEYNLQCGIEETLRHYGRETKPLALGMSN